MTVEPVQNISPFSQKIEAAILSCDRDRATRLINLFVRKERYSLSARYKAAVYWRRMGEYHHAFNVLKKDLHLSKLHKISPDEIDSYLLIIALLTMMGFNSVFLLKLIELPKSLSLRQRKNIGLIYFFCNRYGEAIDVFSECYASESNASPLLTIEIDLIKAISSIYLDQYPAAKKLIEKSLSSTEDMAALRACLMVKCMLDVRMSDGAQAVATALSALTHFSESDEGPDKGTVLQSLGAGYLLEGNFALAEITLQKSLKILTVKPIHSSAWLGSLYYLGLIKKLKNAEPFPEEWARLVVYPSTLTIKCPEARWENVSIPSVITLSLNGQSNAKTAQCFYYIGSEEKVESLLSGDEKFSIGFTALDRAIICLTLAGRFGISEYAFFDYVWRFDSSVASCQKKISQIIYRMRADGLEVSWENGHLSGEGNWPVVCEWTDNPLRTGERFLSTHPTFNRTSVQKYFSISKSQAINLCKEWLEKKNVRTLGEGPKLIYEIIESEKE